MRQKHLFIYPLLLLCSGLLSCDDEEPGSIFSGTVTRASDGSPAVGLKVVFKGVDVGEGLWPDRTPVSEHTTLVQAEGKFDITIANNPRVDQFALEIFNNAGQAVSIVSGCADVFCERFEANKDVKLTLVVDY